MKLSRERKAYAGMLLLGLLALGTDRFIIGHPSTAGADEYSAQPEAAPAVEAPIVPDGPVETAQSARPQTLSVGQRLVQFAGTDPERELSDLFQLPPGWRPQHHEPQVLRPSGQFLSPAEQFQRRKLTGVLVETTGLGRRQAIVDGQAILLGQSLDGFRLVEVTQKSAVFEGDGRQVVLRVIED
jgi:hypothetical protein